jgi:hypothetical protein
MVIGKRIINLLSDQANVKMDNENILINLRPGKGNGIKLRNLDCA